jgi:hypothetical protein
VAFTGGQGLPEAQIAEWRAYFRRRQAIREADVAELEDHLRDQVESLMGLGLTGDEAFLVAVKRMGSVDALSREFAREHSDRLWRQLMAAPAGEEEVSSRRREAAVAVSLAVLAAVLVKLPHLFGYTIEANEMLYARNASVVIFVAPC